MQNLHTSFRAALLKRGFTIRGFARKHHYSEGTVHSAIRGLRSGPKAQSIIEKIQEVTRGR